MTSPVSGFSTDDTTDDTSDDTRTEDKNGATKDDFYQLYEYLYDNGICHVAFVVMSSFLRSERLCHPQDGSFRTPTG
jgi:hypothetical protein